MNPFTRASSSNSPRHHIERTERTERAEQNGRTEPKRNATKERFGVTPLFIAERRQHELRVLDIRPDEAIAHIPGAQRVGAGELRQAVAHLSRVEPLAIVDDDGASARHAAQHLRAMGFCDVVWMVGGMRAWRAAGLPVAFASRALDAT